MRFQSRAQQRSRQQQPVDLVFGAWEPDAGDVGSTLVEAKNVLPTPLGYAPFDGLTATGAALNSTPNSIFWASDESGTFYNFAGGDNELNEWAGSSWRILNTGYASSGDGKAGDRWEFIEFNDRVIAVRKNIAPVYYDLGVSSSFQALPNVSTRGVSAQDDFSEYSDNTELFQVWTDSSVGTGSASLDAVNDEVDLVTASALNWGVIERSFQLEAGRTYTLTVSAAASNPGVARLTVGTTQSGTDIAQESITAGSDVQVIFTPSQSTVWIRLEGSSSLAGTYTFSKVRFAENPPAAKAAAVVRDFIVLGGLEDDDGAVAWSGFNNSEIWGTNPSAQSDRQKLQGRSGDVVKIVGGDEGYIFTTEAIYRMTYVGPPVIFQFDRIRDTVGTDAPDSVVKFESVIWYYSRGGFVAFDGQQVVQIGENRVNQWFVDRARESKIPVMQGAVDRRNRRVFWAFNTENGDDFDTILVYDIGTQRWSYAEVALEAIGEWGGGAAQDRIELVAFDPSFKQETFTGTALTAQLKTGLWQPGGQNGRFKVQDVESVIQENGTGVTTLQVATAENLDAASISLGSAIGRDANGRHHVDLEARWCQFQLNIASDFEEVYMLRLTGYESGRI